jgi:hypothetical protein
MNLNLIAAYWRLNRLPGERLPEIAQKVLEQGVDSASLRILAGEQNATISESGTLFERVLSELNIEIPSQREAVRRIVHYQAQNIISGNALPVKGAEQISEVAYELSDAKPRLSVFVMLADDYEEFSGEYQIRQHGEEYCRNALKQIEEAIIAEANKLLAEKDF